MGLACESDGGDFELDSDNWAWQCNFDITEYTHARGSRCKSCKKMVRKGTECLAFDRLRMPRNEIEERIHGNEVYLAPWYYCERCAYQAVALNALGFTWEVGWDNMQHLVTEYNVTYQGQDDPYHRQ